MNGKNIISIIAIMGLGLMISACAYDQEKAEVEYETEADKREADPRNKNYRSGDIYSGYIAMTSQSRDMQDDDFSNPGFLWVDVGEDLWGKVNGSKGKSCASCHGSAATTMKGVLVIMKLRGTIGREAILTATIVTTRILTPAK